MNAYQQRIREDLAKLGLVGRHDPAVIEAWMRVEHGTLDHLSPNAFRADVAIAVECADASTSAENAALVASYGLDKTHSAYTDAFPATVLCAWCEGSGTLSTGEPCAECAGSGEVRVLA